MAEAMDNKPLLPTVTTKAPSTDVCKLVHEHHGNKSKVHPLILVVLTGAITLVVLILTNNNHFAQKGYSEPIPSSRNGSASFPILFDLLTIEQTGFADTRIQVTTGTGSQATVFYSISATDTSALNETTVTASFNEINARLGVQVISTRKPYYEGKLTVVVELFVPQVLLNGIFNGDKLEISYDGPNIASSFSAFITTGSIHTYSTLETGTVQASISQGSVAFNKIVAAKSLNIKLTNGNVFIHNAVTEKAFLGVDKGKILASISGYFKLGVSTNTGDIDLTLEPGVKNSTNSIKSQSGIVNAVVSNFKGEFFVQSNMRPPKVHGATQMETPTFGKFIGFVGDGYSEHALLWAITEFGFIFLNFV
ncbi:hypothetical protein HK100_002084 [Physocladia obscura]|uniref:DUF4097 domain-containing protein n=1 Tax=Physocladia obscura TaxID=109957 RepID=A0AAD5T1V7_9FUNG|nr:hypothetical protein HK100_002084 [Physocladia obscura]